MGTPIRCGKCKKVLVSTHRHDFVSCKCDAKTFVDGGDNYLRCGGDFVEIQNKETGEWENILEKEQKKQEEKDRGPMYY